MPNVTFINERTTIMEFFYIASNLNEAKGRDEYRDLGRTQVSEGPINIFHKVSGNKYKKG